MVVVEGRLWEGGNVVRGQTSSSRGSAPLWVCLPAINRLACQLTQPGQRVWPQCQCQCIRPVLWARGAGQCLASNYVRRLAAGRTHSGGVQVSEGGGGSGIRQVISRHVDGLEREGKCSGRVRCTAGQKKTKHQHSAPAPQPSWYTVAFGQQHAESAAATILVCSPQPRPTALPHPTPPDRLTQHPAQHPPARR